MKMKVVGMCAALAWAVLMQQAQAATMRTFFEGTTSAGSTDNNSMFAQSINEPGNAGGLPFTVTILWETGPTGFNVLQSTINQDSGTSTFAADRSSGGMPGVVSAILAINGTEIDFASNAQYIRWSRINDPLSSTAALSFMFGGTFDELGSFNLAMTYSAIPGALPLAYDAALQVAAAAFLGANSGMTVTGREGESLLSLGFEATSMTTINLDKPVEPDPATVPLPGAAVLLASGLAGLAALRRKAG